MAATAAELQRSNGAVRLSFKLRGSTTVLDSLYQQGCQKVRFPGLAATGQIEAVLVNTAGGLTDGDRIGTVAEWQPGTAAVLTTQAAERIYAARGDAATVDCELIVGSGAAACWLPQETILFDGGRLERSTTVRLAGNGSLLAVESVVLGRSAMGETVRTGRLCDRWRVVIDGRLIFADAVAFDDAAGRDLETQLASAAVTGGATALATLIYAAGDAADRLPALRRRLERTHTIAGATDLGKLVIVRALAANGRALRDAVQAVFEELQGGSKRPFALPRVWNC